MKLVLLAFTALVIACTPVWSESGHDNCPMHSKHSAEVDSRGDAAMGFDHSKTTHHFRLTNDGGVIEASAKDPADAESVQQIRKHFQEISRLFAQGDFTKPQFIHGRVPPGVEAMQRLKSEIRYEFVETEPGGEVRIRTANPEALAAVHDFLRFQIQDHRTGDSTEVGK